jgi:pilus assembly protein CpaB
MNTYQIRNIGIAVALALVAALLTTFYVTNYKRSVQANETNVPVLVAARDIPAGTAGADVVGSDVLETRKVPKRTIVQGAISEPSQIKNLVATDTVYAGEQVSARRFRPLQEGGVRTQLKGNVRAISVPGTADQLLAGTLREGDRVDVVGSWKYPNDSSQVYVSRVILRDIRVLDPPAGVAKSTKLANGPNGATGSVMLAVTDAQSKKLFWIMQNGEWSLTLRAPRKAADSSEGVTGPVSIGIDGVGEDKFAREMAGSRSAR